MHELKVWPAYYQALASGQKSFELRFDDRGFQVGDLLDLREYDPRTGGYPGGRALCRVDFILGWLDDVASAGLRTRWVVMSLGAVQEDVGRHVCAAQERFETRR